VIARLRLLNHSMARPEARIKPCHQPTRYSVGRTQIPILGELPVLGSILRNMLRTRKRTNLVVFLRPVIVRDEAESSKQSLDRYNHIRAHQTAVQANRRETLPAEDGPALPADPSGPMRPERPAPAEIEP
jgi:general secretion pathway protein D